MQDTWSEMAAFSVGLPDGGVLVVYYAGTQTDHTGLYWVRLESS